ncbi:MAG: 30S ribosomal protein S3 [Candidatus Woesearchaeota archaeon]
MIEKKFVEQKIKEAMIEEFITNRLKNVGHSHTKLQRTPLGEKIIIATSHPGLVVGRKGDNIKDLTINIKREFKLENPQIEIEEVENPFLDAQIVAEKIASTLEKFGANKFKGVGHKTLTDVLAAGALGVEIIISGKIPGARAKTWRFYAGYLKKCGDIALTKVKNASVYAQLKSGTVGVKVTIMPPDVQLPDKVTIREFEEPALVVEDKTQEAEQAEQKKKPAKAPKRQGQRRKKERARPKKEKPDSQKTKEMPDSQKPKEMPEDKPAEKLEEKQ